MIIFKEYIDDLKIKFSEIAKLDSEKNIQYGYQLVYSKGDERVIVSIYYNSKNQFRIVWPKNKNQLCFDLMNKVGSLSSVDFDNIWAGSDESGKGDFFGPLVVSAVVVDKKIAADLQLEGVRDCKQLTDKKILELEHVIMKKVLAFSVLELLPQYYNQRYAQVGNLNTLNASGHFHALKEVLCKVPLAEGALVDQFLNTDIILQELKKIFPQKKFLQRPRAEDNTAVAAASVLARARFLHSMDKLAKDAGVDALPKGSGVSQANVAKDIAQRLGIDSLSKFVKKHFSTYHIVEQELK